jgi:hypothetical protein
MEPEGSLPYLQELSTGPYPEPYPSCPISLRSILIPSTHLRLGLSSGLFPSGFPTNNLYASLIVSSKNMKRYKLMLCVLQFVKRGL